MVNYPQITPYVFYEDVPAALDWLAKAFGFTERMRMEEAGEVVHAEMDLGDGGAIMMGTPSPDYKAPVHLGPPTVGLYVRVDDVDAHCERARAAGAEVQTEPEDKPYGDRNYGALDPEGHQWWFSTPIG